MANNDAIIRQCLDLSGCINQLGLGINSKRAACEIYRQLCDSSADIGADVTAAEYVPRRTLRTQAGVNAMRGVCKVIYLLNVADASGLFVKSSVKAAKESAVKLSEMLVNLTAYYDELSSVNNHAQQPEAANAPAEEAPEQVTEPDPDGFDAPYTEE